MEWGEVEGLINFDDVIWEWFLIKLVIFDPSTFKTISPALFTFRCLNIQNKMKKSVTLTFIYKQLR